ncbi:diguanylate cyclase [Undibacterium danionis]|uniref:diguanylate cyclase n=1 Tax=Undibacterium danionis TaxID=1812100 RepID=A0ABV6IA23_9BURK
MTLLQNRMPLLKVLSSLAAIFTLLGIWLVFELRNGYDQVLKQANYRAAQRSQILGQSLRTQILASDYVLRDVASRIEIIDGVFVDTALNRDKTLSTLLKEKGDTVPDFFSMVLFDRDCKFIATASGQNIGTRSKPELCEARKKFKGSGPMVEYVPGNKSASGRPALVISRHFIDVNGQFLGGVLGVIELEQMQRWFDSLDIAAYDSVSLVDNSQLLLARKPAMPFYFEKQMTTEEDMNLLSDKYAKSGIATTIDIDGLERLFGIYKIEDFPFAIVYGFEKLAILKQWRTRAIELSIGYCILLLLAGFVVRSHITVLRQHNEISKNNALLRSNEANFRMLAENMADIVWQINSFFKVKYINAADERVRGYSNSEIVGIDIREQFTELGQEIFQREIDKRLQLEKSGNKGLAMNFELPMCCKDGREMWVEISSVPIYGEDGEIEGYQGVARDISLRRQHEEKLIQANQEMENRLLEATEEKTELQELALHDAMTGLYNRRFLDAAIVREITLSEREKRPLAVIMLDLDHFKNVNDQFGHSAGDLVLKALADIMRQTSRESDLICRYGGEEFIAIIPNMSASQAFERAEIWRRQLEENSLNYGENEIKITLSAGIAIYPDHGKSGEELILCADEMLYKSKRSGRNQVSIA